MSSLENKLLYLASFKIFVLIVSFTIIFSFCLICTIFVSFNDNFRETFIGLNIPQWAWPWNYSERDFLNGLFMSGDNVMSKEDIDLYINFCSFFSLLWIFWAIFNFLLNLYSSGWLNKTNRLLPLFLTGMIITWGSSQHLILTRSLYPSVFDSIEVLSLKKLVVISVNYLSAMMFIVASVNILKGNIIYRSYSTKI